ncbi:MAG: YcaO-related McrA-glycine thioamidation protein [Methanomassiliicoccales archaeon]
MILGPAPKLYTEDGHRTVDPLTTLKRIEPLCPIAGVTRVADITGLDRVGIPVYSSIRPDAQSGAISVYNGKGASKIQAKVSAIMEALERYSGEVRGDEIVRKNLEDMLSSHNCVDPRDLILPLRTIPHLFYQNIAWVKGYDLQEKEPIYVPACAVFHPYNSKLDMPLFRTNTNGLASGNTLEEAIVHGACEVIERDAWSICEMRRQLRGDIEQPHDDKLIRSILEKFISQEIDIYLKDLTSDLGIPTFAAAADDVRMKDAALLCLGIGTHLNPRIALIRALTEVAQSRVTQIHGAREDTVRASSSRSLGYEKMKRLNAMWFSSSTRIKPLSSYNNLDTPDLFEDLMVIIDILKSRGFKRLIAVNLTRKELGVPVVRVIIPGMEVYAMDEERMGNRSRGG